MGLPEVSLDDVRVAHDVLRRAARDDLAGIEHDDAVCQRHDGPHDVLDEHDRRTPVSDVADDPDIFLGALSDLTGEIVRRAVLLASERNAASVQKMFHDVTDTVAFMLQMDLTGNLRQKVDQARQNLRKMEEIRYDLSIK